MGRVQFGRFEFDPLSGELLRDGVPRPLQPQPARMLAALVSRPGAIVTRDELRRAIWGDDTHVDYDKGLNFCAAQVRAALGDSATEPHFVETVHRRGYRFAAALVHTDAREAVVSVTGDAGPAPPVSRTSPSPALVLALIVLAITVGGLVAGLRAVRPMIIAVVPFQNETGSSDADRLAKGISDTAVAKLAGAAGSGRLKVVGNASELRFTFRPPDLQRIGEALGAQFIVLGQLKRDDRSYRLVAHLIRVSDQTHVWASTYDRSTLTLADQAALADAIAGEIASRVTATRGLSHLFR